MNPKSRLGRKDIFTDNQVNRKKDSEVTIKPEKKETRIPYNQTPRKPE